MINLLRCCGSAWYLLRERAEFSSANRRWTEIRCPFSKPDPRAETRKVGGNASSVADEFEVSALSWTAVTKSGATLH